MSNFSFLNGTGSGPSGIVGAISQMRRVGNTMDSLVEFSDDAPTLPTTSDFDFLVRINVDPDRAKAALAQNRGLQEAMEWLLENSDTAIGVAQTPTHAPQPPPKLSDFNYLEAMGFAPDKIEIALAQNKELEDAIEWLVENQDTPIEAVQSETTIPGPDPAVGTAEKRQEKGKVPIREHVAGPSQRCLSCRVVFATITEAEEHAADRQHDNFEPVFVPRSPSLQATEIDTIESPESVEARRNVRHTARQPDEVEGLEERRILGKPTADQLERKRKAAESQPRGEQKMRRTEPRSTLVTPAVAMLKLKIAGQMPISRRFPQEATLADVANIVLDEHGFKTNSFTFPPGTTFTSDRYGLTLREAKLVPNAVLMLR